MKVYKLRLSIFSARDSRAEGDGREIMCDCLTRINEGLAEQNEIIETVNVVDTATGKHLRSPVAIPVLSTKTGGRKRLAYPAPHCPFCGKKYPKITEAAKIRAAAEGEGENG